MAYFFDYIIFVKELSFFEILTIPPSGGGYYNEKYYAYRTHARVLLLFLPQLQGRGS